MMTIFIIGILCSLLVLVPVIMLLSMDKSSRRYTVCWWSATIAFASVCFVTFAYVMIVPYYSQTTHSPRNPGGPSGNIFVAILLLVFFGTVVVPSFPALLLLGFFPPKSHNRRHLLTIAIALYTIILAALILFKYQAYMADYQQTRQKRLQGDQFKHLRR